MAGTVWPDVTNPWPGWLVGTSTGTVTITDTSTAVWPSWCTESTAASIAAPDYYAYGQRVCVELTDEEKAAIREQEEAAALSRKKRTAQRKQAEKKAKALLHENLNTEQRKEYKKKKSFIVVSRSGKRYRIKKGRQHNVYLLEADREVREYCAHPQGPVPDEDTVLTQKLLLEHHEDHFLNVANSHRLC